ncbi:MAG: glyoxalase [Chloroflexi bacterium 54-19]|nr:MAG: glyoxalase [Chloroflexi bacterium 54-19]
MSENNVTAPATPEMRLEVVMLPVADVDRARNFYVEKMGFNLDHDVVYGAMRIVQLTPPGSACSVVIGKGMASDSMTPGSIKGLHLVVKDAQQVRDLLAGRGIEISEVEDMGGVKYAHLSDPDGNSWEIQEIPSNLTAP